MVFIAYWVRSYTPINGGWVPVGVFQQIDITLIHINVRFH